VFVEPLASNGLLRLFVAAGTFVTEPLPSYGHIRYNMFTLGKFKINIHHHHHHHIFSGYFTTLSMTRLYTV
jgi:hypothetical protein